MSCLRSDGLDLDEPFDVESTRLLEEGVQEELGMSTFVSFTGVEEYEPAPVHEENDYLRGFQESSRAEYDDSEFTNIEQPIRQDPFYLSTKPKESESIAQDKPSRKKKKKRRGHAVLRDELMPEGAKSSDEDEPKRHFKKSHSTELADIDITVPLAEDERIPDDHLYHRQTVQDETLVKKVGTSPMALTVQEKSVKKVCMSPMALTVQEKKRKTKSKGDKKKKKKASKDAPEEPLLIL